jgi:starch synthase
MPEVLPTLGLNDSQQALIVTIGEDQPSMMLLGMHAADVLVTCSPTYAAELQTALAQTPMSEPMRRLGITGIVTGIDTNVWNPARSDTSLVPYTAADVRAGKRANKLRLQARCGFTEDADCPVFGVCARLVPEKGIDFVLQVFADFLRTSQLQLVVMGVGDRPYVEALRRLEAAHPAHVRYFPAFDPCVAQLLYAGCDFTLMPSLFEPCGLNQLIAMRYGTISIVSAVGGLKDTVTDLRQEPKRGLGFVMSSVCAAALEKSVMHAMAWLQGDSDLVDEVRQRAMGQDWSWRRAAAAYTTLYGEALRGANAAGCRMEINDGLARARTG